MKNTLQYPLGAIWIKLKGEWVYVGPFKEKTAEKTAIISFDGIDYMTINDDFIVS